MQDMMQWATVYAMPLALGVAKTFSDEVDMVKEVDPIFYWWQPLELMGAANKRVCDQPIGFAEPFQRISYESHWPEKMRQISNSKPSLNLEGPSRSLRGTIPTAGHSQGHEQLFPQRDT